MDKKLKENASVIESLENIEKEQKKRKQKLMNVENKFHLRTDLDKVEELQKTTKSKKFI